jgi:hypothetical protein
MKDFFVSYTANDEPWAVWIAWQLEQAGYSTVLQAWDFPPGSSFVVEMDKAAKGSKRTLAVLSPRRRDRATRQPDLDRLQRDPQEPRLAGPRDLVRGRGRGPRELGDRRRARRLGRASGS